MLNTAKSSLTSCCVGFVRDRGAWEAKKKKGFSHLPPPRPHNFFRKNKALLRGVSRYPPHFKSLAALPNPPPPHLGKFFVFPILWLVSDLMYIICLFMQLRILSGGSERHVCCFAYLIMLKSSVFSFTLFLFGTILWYPIYFSPHSGHSYTFSKLPKAAVAFHQHYPYNGFNCTDFSRKKK